MSSSTPRNWLIAMLVNLFTFGSTFGAELEVGMDAPPFALPDQTGKLQNLSDYREKWVVVYFYPKDDTPGCTAEACRFRDDIVELNNLGAQVIGVSIDNTASHAEFAKKYGLPFPLLADTDGAVATKYGSLWKLGPVRFAKRHTFIIAPDGRIAKIYRSVNPKQHSQEVIADLKHLQSSSG